MFKLALIWMQISLLHACIPEKHTHILIQNYDGPIYLTSCQTKDPCPLYHIANCPKPDSDCTNKMPDLCHDEKDLCLEGTVSLQLTPHHPEVPLYIPKGESCPDSLLHQASYHGFRPQIPCEPSPDLAYPCAYNCRPQIPYEATCSDFLYQAIPCRSCPQIPCEPCYPNLPYQTSCYPQIPFETTADFSYYQAPCLSRSQTPLESSYLDYPPFCHGCQPQNVYPTSGTHCGNPEYPCYHENSEYLKAFAKGDTGSMTYWQPKYANHNNCHCCKYCGRY